MRRTVLFFAWPQYDAPELEFWEDLQRELGALEMDLVLVATTAPPAGFPIRYLPFVPSVDAFWNGHGRAPVRVTALGLDADTLLAREEAWSGPTALPAVRDLRRQALDAIATYAVRMLTAIRPAAAVIWNGQHVPEMILEAALRRGGTPPLYVERAPFPRALFADERGLSAASAIACEDAWPLPAERWLCQADSVAARIAGGNLTWWAQPENAATEPLRRRLNIPTGSRVVLFAGQVDEDTQRFLFSPVFQDNLAAFKWLLDALAGRDDVFVLGKHHPKATTPPEAYAALLAGSSVSGTWVADVAIDDALAVSERVAAVNSTVLYEALARGIPVLAMGDWLLRGRGVAHQVQDPVHGRQAVDAWLAATDTEYRQQRWRAALGHLLSRAVYAYERTAVRAGALGARDLACRIARRCADTPWQAPPDLYSGCRDDTQRPWRNPGEPREEALLEARWADAQLLRHSLLRARAAARCGRRVLVWGTGEAGRIANDLLAGCGVVPAAFVSSDSGHRTVESLPVIPPEGLRAGSPRDFVIVASVAAPEILEALTVRGFTVGSDALAVDCLVLRDLALPTLAC